MLRLTNGQRALIRAGDLEVSSDLEVQRALERIPVETAATYSLAARCWLWIGVCIPRAGTIEDVAVVRKLCEQRNVGVREHRIIDQARKLAHARLEASRAHD